MMKAKKTDTVTLALLHDIASIVQRVVPRNDHERQAIERFVRATTPHP